MLAIAGLGVGLVGCLPSLRGADASWLVWPDGAPGARGVREHDTPRLYVYRPDPSIATDTAIVVASGGSYGHHGGLSREAEPTAKWLTSMGITAIVVRYRVGRGGYDHRAFIADGARAVQIVRARSDELAVAPDRIGMIGYSAGGHLAASLATRCTASTAVPIELPNDALSEVSCRPDFVAAVYPVITLHDPVAHARSRRNMLGRSDDRSAWIDKLSIEHNVVAESAPIFLVHSRRDRKVDPANSELLHAALIAHGVPTELHLYDDGAHGVGLAQDGDTPQMSGWPAAFVAWAKGLGKL